MGEEGGPHISLNWMIPFVNGPLLVSIDFEMSSVSYLMSSFLKVMYSGIVQTFVLSKRTSLDCIFT